MNHKVCKLAIGLILLGSGLLWIEGSNWGQPYHFHSDEFFYITRTINDPSVPFWTIYGRLPIYLLLAVARLTSQVASSVVLARKISTLTVIGGVLAASFSARRLTGWTGAVVTTALLAGAPVVVQSAHFFITDVFLFTGVALTILFSFRVAGYGQWYNSLGLGLAWGLAMGSKPSGLFLLPAVVLANLVGKTPHVRRRLTISFIVAACIALIGQPTLLVRGLRAYLFVGGLLHHLDVAAGVSLPPYTLQFANTPRWTYYLSHLLRWGAGPLLLTIGSAGGILAAIRLVSSRREWRTDSHLGQLAVTWLVFAAFYLLSAGQRDQFSRYVLPLLPPLAILSGWFVTEHIQRLSSTWRRLVVVMIVITALVPGLMYARIYRRPDTRLQAAVWVERNIPPGSAICHEPDLGFAVPPIGMGGPAFGTTRSQNYQGTMLDWGLLYWASDYVRQNQSVPVTEKLEMQSVRTQAQQRLRIQSWLATCDWLILSDRFADQYLPLPNDFEAISTFYADLLSNRHVDFQKIAEFRSLPGMFNFTIDDRESELTFRSFDHPTIWVFHRRQS